MIWNRLRSLLGRDPAPARPGDTRIAANERPGAAVPQAGREALSEGRRLLEERRFGEAIELLERALADAPEPAPLHVLLAHAHRCAGHGEDAADALVLALHFDPANFEALFALGTLALESGDAATARERFDACIAVDPGSAPAWANRGAARARAGDAEGAAGDYRRALELAPESPELLGNLGLILFRECERHDEGFACLERALALRPHDAAIRGNHAHALLGLGRPAEALAAAEALLREHPESDDWRLLRSYALLTLGRFEEAWEGYEARRSNPDFRESPDSAPERVDGEFRGQRVLVYGEQGLGDEIMFASCLPDLVADGAACHVHCAPKLVPIFRRSFPAVAVAAHGTPSAGAGNASAFDRKIALGSLPRRYRRSRGAFPARRSYLLADPGRVASWKSKLESLGPGLKVGISWRGGLAHTRRALRSIEPESLGPLLRAEGVGFVSLQYTECAEDLAALERIAGRRIAHWQEAIDDYDETAALVEALDLVISVCTAVVHLGGALGAPVWVLVPRAPEWRYGLEGAAMPWYPSVRLFRQQHAGRWDDVLGEVGHALARRIAGRE